jgi:hypothetical protein
MALKICCAPSLSVGVDIYRFKIKDFLASDNQANMDILYFFVKKVSFCLSRFGVFGNI